MIACCQMFWTIQQVSYICWWFMCPEGFPNGCWWLMCPEGFPVVVDGLCVLRGFPWLLMAYMSRGVFCVLDSLCVLRGPPWLISYLSWGISLRCWCQCFKHHSSLHWLVYVCVCRREMPEMQIATMRLYDMKHSELQCVICLKRSANARTLCSKYTWHYSE